MPRPRNDSTTALATTPSASTGVSREVMSAEEREALLRSQGQQVTTFQRLPQINIMPAGAGLFEFVDTQDTPREFLGVILNSHPRHVLWDRPYGAPPVEGQEGPACASPDGVIGMPRPGFVHLALNREATGQEEIGCAGCAYNRWNSKSLIDPTSRSRGKACTNQKSLYVSVPGREVPMEMIIPPTSIREFDAYIANLTNQGILALGIQTRFKQKIEQAGTMRWAVLVLERAEALDDDTFMAMVAKRRQYERQITPESALKMAAAAAAANEALARRGEPEEGDTVPF